MARPRNDNPTPAELEVLKVIWENGPATVREVLEVLHPRDERAYTSVMSLMNVMADKGLLQRKPKGRAFIYAAKAKKEKTLGRMVGDLLGRAYEGSASALVTHVLEHANPTDEELAAIREAIENFKVDGTN